MCVMNDVWIRRMCEGADPMIAPFEPNLITVGASYGVSSYGYDFRLANEFRIFHNTWSSIIDPACIPQEAFVEHVGDYCLIPPNSFVLGRSVEYFQIPRNVLVLCVGKSSLARAGIFVGLTPAEPSWKGHLTIEIANVTPLPAKVYAGQGISQAIFIRAAEECEVSYADRKGKYQGQTGVTLPKV